MDKAFLFKSAESLKSVSEKAAAEYTEKQDRLVSKINCIMLSRTDLMNLTGPNNVEMMKDNHSNHARFMASIMLNYNSQVFLETVLWVFRAYRTHGFSSNYWAAQLNAWIKVLGEEMTDESFKEIYPFYKWMQINIPQFVLFSDEEIIKQKSLH